VVVLAHVVERAVRAAGAAGRSVDVAGRALLADLGADVELDGGAALDGGGAGDRPAAGASRPSADSPRTTASATRSACCS
jgi:hypothetical protein